MVNKVLKPNSNPLLSFFSVLASRPLEGNSKGSASSACGLSFELTCYWVGFLAIWTWPRRSQQEWYPRTDGWNRSLLRPLVFSSRCHHHWTQRCHFLVLPDSGSRSEWRSTLDRGQQCIQLESPQGWILVIQDPACCCQVFRVHYVSRRLQLPGSGSDLDRKRLVCSWEWTRFLAHWAHASRAGSPVAATGAEGCSRPEGCCLGWRPWICSSRASLSEWWSAALVS